MPNLSISINIGKKTTRKKKQMKYGKLFENFNVKFYNLNIICIRCVGAKIGVYRGYISNKIMV